MLVILLLSSGGAWRCRMRCRNSRPHMGRGARRVEAAAAQSLVHYEPPSQLCRAARAPRAPCRHAAPAAAGADHRVHLLYCSQHTLSAHAAAWSAWPKHERALLFFLIIDDGSPHRRTAALPPDVHSRLRLAIVRIEQDLPWNLGGARNLIFATAPTEHVLVMDMDVEAAAAGNAAAAARAADGQS